MTEPQCIYKYRHFGSPDDRERTRNLLTRCELYFASPAQFNDPFDCKVPPLDNISTIEFRKMYTRAVRTYIPKLSVSDVKKHVTKLMVKKPQTERAAEARAFLQKEVDNVGICSFSAQNDDILMWSHYASAHTGFALEFASTSATPLFGSSQQVKYADTYEFLRDLADNDAAVERILLTKSAHWSYENEWRIVDHEERDGRVGPHKFDPALLTGVIFGCLMPAENRNILSEMVAQGPGRPKFYAAQMRVGAFALDIVPL